MTTYTTPNTRHHFLRGLAALPLIGGSVTVLGNPIGAAVATTDAMVSLYGALCLSESQHVLRHFQGRGMRLDYTLSTAWGEHGHLFPGGDGFASRVPVILSAAGVPLA